MQMTLLSLLQLGILSAKGQCGVVQALRRLTLRNLLKAASVHSSAPVSGYLEAAEKNVDAGWRAIRLRPEPVLLPHVAWRQRQAQE